MAGSLELRLIQRVKQRTCTLRLDRYARCFFADRRQMCFDAGRFPPSRLNCHTKIVQYFGAARAVARQRMMQQDAMHLRTSCDDMRGDVHTQRLFGKGLGRDDLMGSTASRRSHAS